LDIVIVMMTIHAHVVQLARQENLALMVQMHHQMETKANVVHQVSPSPCHHQKELRVVSALLVPKEIQAHLVPLDRLEFVDLKDNPATMEIVRPQAHPVLQAQLAKLDDMVNLDRKAVLETMPNVEKREFLERKDVQETMVLLETMGNAVRMVNQADQVNRVDQANPVVQERMP